MMDIRCRRGLALMVHKLFDKKSASLAKRENLAKQDKSTSGGAIKNKIIFNKELAEELHKPINRKIKKRKSTLIFYR